MKHHRLSFMLRCISMVCLVLLLFSSYTLAEQLPQNIKCGSTIYNSQPKILGPTSTKKKAHSATLTEKLAARSGPSTMYTELATYSINTEISVIEQITDNHNVLWALVEFNLGGLKQRAYTGMKRIKCNERAVPWGVGSGTKQVTDFDAYLYSGPGTDYTNYGVLPKGSEVIVYDYENGYALVDFQLGIENWIRGYIEAD